jgi:Na+-transporting NADH:ubiquinone oxidoreductase subunit C
MKKFSIKPTIFVVVITLLYTTVLATINAVTIDRITLNERLSDQLSFLYVQNIEPENDEAEYINQLYEQFFQQVEVNGYVFYEAYDEQGNLDAYVITITGNAVWGELTGLVSLSPELDIIQGIDFLSHSETPGLGGRIDEPAYKEQFRGIEIDPDEEARFLMYRPDPSGQVDAISGATGTSNAVLRIVNEELRLFMSEIREELNNE